MSDNTPSPQAALLEAIAHHRAGRLGEAEQLYRRVVEYRPDLAEAYFRLGDVLKATGALEDAVGSYRKGLALQSVIPEAWVNLGNTLTALGAFDDAVASYHEAIMLRPGFSEAYYNLGNAHKAQGRLAEAVAAYRQAIVLKPDFVLAHYNFGNTLRAQGKPDEAAASYRHALALRPNYAEAHNNLGTLLFERGKAEDAILSYRRALSARPDYPEALNNLGTAYKSLGKPDEAAEACRRALALRPEYAEAHNNLGILLFDQGKLADALACYSRALELQPDYAEAHNNLGNLLKEEGKLPEAIACYRSAIECRPDYTEAHNHLGVALCECHRIAEGFAWFTRGAQLNNFVIDGPPRSHKARHDAEQDAYLSGRNSVSGGRLHIESGARLAGPAINLRNNIGEIDIAWQTEKPQIAVIDNLLTPEALENVRRFCWGSTIWHEVFEDGYLGARPESGFAAPLLAQVAEELRAAYPGIFRNHPLLYSWAFKYDRKLGGTRIHADFAAVNVNFWITPDEANLDPNTGGLVVWDVAAPLDWDFAKYNAGEAAIRDFLARSRATPVRIPYRSNRAVIFDSDLFHETDQMAFKDGYQNRRINLTLLFGHRGC